MKVQEYAKIQETNYSNKKNSIIKYNEWPIVKILSGGKQIVSNLLNNATHILSGRISEVCIF